MSEIRFKSSLTTEEIENNFKDVDFFSGIMEGLTEALAYEKGKLISGLDAFENSDGYYCFHAGTKQTEGGIVTNGGRVLGVTAKGSNLKEARANAYKATEWINFENKYMRNDIGKSIDEVD